MNCQNIIILSYIILYFQERRSRQKAAGVKTPTDPEYRERKNKNQRDYVARKGKYRIFLLCKVHVNILINYCHEIISDEIS